MKEILLTSPVLIGVVMVLRWLLRGKVRQRLLYAAWLLVALRLLVPIQFGQWSFSLNTLTQTVTERSPTLQQAQQVLTAPVAGPSEEEVRQHLTQEYRDQGLDPKTPEVQVLLETQVEAETTGLTVLEVLKLIWLVGICIMALWFLLTNLIFMHRAKIHSRILETDAPVCVRVSDGVSTPCLAGLFRPVIYVTADCTEDPQVLRHVLTHEIAHLRQWDPLWSLVRCICLCIYWFHPLVWVAAAQSRRDCELSCDESALKQLGDDERIAYGKTLLAMIRASSAPNQLIKTSTSMNESKKQLKERMCFIVKKPKNLLIAAIAMVLIIAVAAGCAFTGGTTPEKTPSETEPTTETTTQPITESSPPPQTEPPTTKPVETDDTYIPEPHALIPPLIPMVQTEGPTEAQRIAEKAIAIYRTYSTIGTCCEMERPDGYEDMSQYLTEAQKEDYHNYQYRITCCKTIEEVHEHIDRYIGKDEQHNDTDNSLFTDDAGNLYVMVVPTAYDSYRHFDVISQTKNEIVCRACMYYEPECDGSDIFTLKAAKDGYLVTRVERDLEYQCEATLLYGNENYQLYRHGDTGFSGILSPHSGYGTLHFQEEYYCPTVTQLSEYIWEIAADHGDGHVQRDYWNLRETNNPHTTYHYAIALGHKKIAYLAGDLEDRTLVVCDLFDSSTAQTFTALEFKAENMPVTAAVFSDNDTQLTLTYYTDQDTQTNVTLELIP